MVLNLAALISDMDALSRMTWRRVLVGDASGLKMREDSITDHNLFELMESHPELSVRRFNQNAEKKVGADWEWWIGSTRLGWFRLRIQAKRVHDASYRELDHPGAIEGDYQYQTLIDECTKGDATYPFHVFYNGWRENRFLEKFESDHYFNSCGCGGSRQDLWGCGVMSSRIVMDLHLGSSAADWRKRSYVPRYMPEMLPWSRLFTFVCPSVSHHLKMRLNKSTPDAIFREMHKGVFVADSFSRGELSERFPDGQGIKEYIDEGLSGVELFRELPDYANKARLARRSFLADGMSYVEDNPNLRPAVHDDPHSDQPGIVSVLDLELDPDEVDLRFEHHR